jgi:cytochrome P450
MELVMAAATERVVVLMTPAEKRALERKAKAAHLSAGELVRRSVEAFDPRLADRSVVSMLESFAASHETTVRALDNAEHELAETRAYFARKREGRRG